MSVTFVRTGERRYAVRAALEGKPVVEMNPAPGYDALMPHDLQHFIVERELGIDGGIFGQLAAGGDAATFHVVGVDGNSRTRSREARRRARKRHNVSYAADASRSERATYICWHDWLSHSQDASLRVKARAMQATVDSMLRAMPADERGLHPSAKSAQIRNQFQRLSERWRHLRIGEGFTEAW